MCLTCEMMMAQADLDQPGVGRGLEEYPPEWQADYQKLSELIFALAVRHQEQVRIRIWDPRSFQGMLKSIRYGIRRYPTFIVNGKIKLTGWDQEELEKHIQAAAKSGNSAI